MRLIDADEFEKQIAGMTIANNYPVKKASALCDLIDEQPTAYDPDKVVEQLEECGEQSCDDCPYLSNNEIDCKQCAMLKAIEIVRGGGLDG